MTRHYTSSVLNVDNVQFDMKFGELTVNLPNGVYVAVVKSFQAKVHVPQALENCMEVSYFVCSTYNWVLSLKLAQIKTAEPMCGVRMTNLDYC